MSLLSPLQAEKLTALASALIDQKAARVLVEPYDRSTGHWFGGGNILRDRDRSFLICGRYRNYGDSRTGVGSGERGRETAVFRADSFDGPWEKVVSFSKAELSHGGLNVVSIEGVALHHTPDGIEFFISTEKDEEYPERLHLFQKPGAGVWSIDRIAADRIVNLCPSTIETIVLSDQAHPERLHCKDPWVFDLPNGDLVLGYCTHPFTWSSSCTTLVLRKKGASAYESITTELLTRGPVWDIAAARITERLAVPKLGVFADGPDLSLYFYDSCESLRQLDENPKAVSRPRGWSCEEIGGIAVGVDTDLTKIQRLSVEAPLFVSPHGTGCSRYVATFADKSGIYAVWQQSQDDLSQPLVGHFLPMDRVEQILS